MPRPMYSFFSTSVLSKLFYISFFHSPWMKPLWIPSLLLSLFDKTPLFLFTSTKRIFVRVFCFQLVYNICLPHCFYPRFTTAENGQLEDWRPCQIIVQMMELYFKPSTCLWKPFCSYSISLDWNLSCYTGSNTGFWPIGLLFHAHEYKNNHKARELSQVTKCEYEGLVSVLGAHMKTDWGWAAINLAGQAEKKPPGAWEMFSKAQKPRLL